MKITNNHNLPEPIVRTLTNREYNRGSADYTVTELLKPSWVSHLGRKHRHEKSIDVADLLSMQRGTLLHGILGEATEDDIIEKRFQILCGKFTLSGQIDWFRRPTGIIYDLKTMTDSQHKFDKPEHEEQVNIYAEILRQEGEEVKGCAIIKWFVNHSKVKAEEQAGYPPIEMITKPVPLWDSSRARDFIASRIEAHENPTPCTPEETWAKFAVQKPGLKRASKVEDTRAAAQAWADENINDVDQYSIEHRPGIRCKYYCKSVSPFCDRKDELASG